MNYITGVTFNEAWKNRQVEDLTFEGKSFAINHVGKSELRRNNKATGRPKDADDLNHLHD